MEPDRADFQRLLAGYLEGDLSPEDREQLRNRIEADPSLRQEFLEELRFHEAMKLVGREAPAETRTERSEFADRIVTEATRPAETRKKPTRRIPRLPGRRRSTASPLLPILLAAGVLAGIAILVLAMSTSPTPAPPTVRAPEPVPLPVPPKIDDVPAAPRRPTGTVPRTPTMPGRASTPPPVLPEAEPRKADPVPAPVTPPKPPPTTRSLIASVTESSGTVILISDGKEIGRRPPAGLEEGQGILTRGSESRATLRFPDGTTLTVEGDTFVPRIESTRGKRVVVHGGSVRADVARQPKDLPLRFSMPHAEATVLGTSLRVFVTPGPSSTVGFSRLEVTKGRVRLKRLRDGKRVDVRSGHYAVAGGSAIGMMMRALPLPTEPLLIEVEDLGPVRRRNTTDPTAGKILMRNDPAASGGRSVWAPGVGTEIAGNPTLFTQQRWYLWIRYRDDDKPDDQGVFPTFEVRVHGKALGKVVAPGKGKAWLWKRFDFVSAAESEIVLRSLYAGKTINDPSLYNAVNRWDRIALTRDPDYVPKP